MKNLLLYTLLGLGLLLPSLAVAAPSTQNFVNIAPFLPNMYDNGTVSLPWLHFYTKYASTTALTVSGQTTGCAQFDSTGFLTSTGSACGSSGGGTFPFTITTQYGTTTAATSTPLFLRGSRIALIASSTSIFDNASSTQLSTTDAWITKLRNLATNGFVKTSASDGTLTVDTSTYLTGNQTVTLSGVVTGSGATAITTAFGSQVAGVLGSAITGNTAPLATSTLYGAVQNGKVLAGSGGNLVYVATTTPGTGLTYDGTAFNVGGLTTAQFASANISQWTNNSNYITLASLSGTAPIAYNSSTGAFSWTGLATTSQPSSSNLLTSNGTSGVYGTATSTLTASGPLTGSFTQVGSGGALGCTTAASGVAGCLSGTAFDTFNNKQAALTATWPEILTGATLSFGWATTSQPSSSNLFVSNGTNGFYGVGTSTLSATGPLTGSFTQVGSGGALGCTTASAAAAGCISIASFNLFNNKIGTSSSETAGQLGYFTTTNGTPALLSGVATGTVSAGSTAITVTAGRSAIGGALAIDCATASVTAAGCVSIASFNSFTNKIGTSSVLTAGQLLYATTNSIGNTVAGIATTSVSCSGFLTCTGFTALGAASTITTTGQLAIASGGTNASSFGTTNGIVAYDGTRLVNFAGYTLTSSLFTATNASTTLFGGLNVYLGNSATSTFLSTGSIGLSSSTPSTQWGMSIGTTTVWGNSQFAGLIASSSVGAATYTVDWDTGNTQRFILNQNSTFTINATSSHPKNGGMYKLKLCQDTTGSRTVTFANPNELIWEGGNGATTTVTSTASSVTLIAMLYDSRVARYDIVASSSKADPRACVP